MFQISDIEIPSLTLWLLAWIFLVIGIIALIALVLYTKFGRELSIKLSVISVAFASIFLGFAIHFFLKTFGI
jgi:hypothetical protein